MVVHMAHPQDSMASNLLPHMASNLLLHMASNHLLRMAKFHHKGDKVYLVLYQTIRISQLLYSCLLVI